MPTRVESMWERFPTGRRTAIVRGLWFVTWLGLIAGLYDRAFFGCVVIFSLFHAFLFLALFRFRITPFPVQVRVAYFVWVALGTYVPYLFFLMYVTLVGLATNLFLGYCPLARMLYLLPWNREEALSLSLVGRVFLSPPTTGQFRPIRPAARPS